VRTALTSLRPEETVQVLAELVKRHPELAAEAEKLAAVVIAPQRRDQIEASVSRRLRGLDIDDLAERAGMHRGQYIEPWTAAGELIDETVGPHLEDVRRLAGLGRVADAHEVAAGVLAGLYACGDVPGTRCSVMWSWPIELMRSSGSWRAWGCRCRPRQVPI
jgi:hypothetical protein